MIPIVLVSDSLKKTNSYLREYVKKNDVGENFIFSLKPLTKEFSIEQIRELKRNIIYNFSKLRLYILHDFDTASFEAQNAFLKTLEEHQQTIQFVLIVKNPHKLAATILSRSKIVNLGDEAAVEQDPEFERLLEDFIRSQDLKILTSAEFQLKKTDNHESLLRKMVLFFRQKFVGDEKSTRVLREILVTRSVIENNHVDPQSGVDHLLLYIRKLYGKNVIS